MEMDICRGCLTSGRKMAKAILYEAEFKDLTGICISPSDRLPQWLCYECIALLQKCVRFGNKVMQSHIMLCQYVLENVPFPCDKDGDPHLKRSVVSHCDVPGTQTEQLEDLIEKTIVDDINMPDVTNLDNVLVKEEVIFGDAENNIAEEKSWEQNLITNTDDETKTSSCNLSELDTKNICLVMSNHEDLSEQGVAQAQINSVLSDIDLEVSIVKNEMLSFDHEDNISLQDWCIDEETELISKSSPLKANDKEHADEEKMRSGVVLFETRAVRYSTRAQARLNEHTETTATPLRQKHEELSRNNVYNNISVNDKSPHSTKSYICDECKKCFNKKILLIAHIQDHTKHKPYKCDICTKSLFTKSGLKLHYLTHAGQKPYKCDICKKSFSQKQNLDTHYRTHTGEKPYKCDVCMQCFSDRSILVRHSLTHTNEKPYKCDVCMKDFRRPSHLRAHVSSVHNGDKPYQCNVCMKSFNQKIHLYMHARTHEGDKPYKCDVCFKCFYNKNALNKHTRIHSKDDIKTYKMKCDVCMKGFNVYSNFMRHMRTHTGEKPFKCDVCMKGFIDKGTYKKHVRIHTGEKPYKCDTCNKCFGQKCHLNSHYLTHSRHP